MKPLLVEAALGQVTSEGRLRHLALLQMMIDGGALGLTDGEASIAVGDGAQVVVVDSQALTRVMHNWAEMDKPITLQTEHRISL